MPDFEAVFRENQEFVFRYLMKLCGDRSLAEELTQETFYRAYINFAGLRDLHKASAWLCQIGKNTYFAWLREQKKQEPLEQEQLSDGSPDLAEFFAQKELSAKAYAHLHRLQEPYKEVFLLFVFGGLSHKQISALFGKSESWARVTFYRAKEKIMEGMKKDGL